jgi:PAS domain S-box-containing protein
MLSASAPAASSPQPGSEENPQQAAPASEPRFQLTLDGLLEGCQIIGFDWRYLYLNESAAQQGQRPREELLGRTMLEAYPGIEATDLFSVLRRCMEERIPQRMLNRFAYADGSAAWFELSIQPCPDGIFVLSSDVTERERGAGREPRPQHLAEASQVVRDNAERRQAEEQLRYQADLLAQVSDAIISTDATFRIKSWNKAAEDLYGWSAQEAIGRMMHEIVPTSYLNDDPAQVSASFLSQGRWQGEVTQPHKDGSPRLILSSVSLIKDSSGAFIGAVGVNRDISERKQAALALESERRRLRTLIDNLPDLIFLKDREGRFIVANQAVAHFMGVASPEQLIGKTDFDFYPYQQAAEYNAYEQAIMQSGEPLMGWEKAQRDLYGNLHWLSTIKIALRDTQGQVVGLVGIERNITARRQAEEEVHKLNDELEQRVADRTAELEAAIKELEAFSYSVSHDLRAPLRAIDGFSRILLSDYSEHLPPEAQGYFARVRNNAQQMSHLIDDLLAFAQLGRHSLARRSVEPVILVQRALAELHAEQAGRQIEVSVGDLPSCEGDPTLLMQVWINLLANALKYTRRCNPAQITVGAQVDEHQVTYYVRDNGIGFDMRYVDKLFGVFQRLHHAEDYEGTGVGLAIVQRIIQRHGGQIWAEAQVGQGATFFFTLGDG